MTAWKIIDEKGRIVHNKSGRYAIYVEKHQAVKEAGLLMSSFDVALDVVEVEIEINKL